MKTPEAPWFAMKAHAGQKRKYTGEPYLVHCAEVADLVRAAGLDDDVIAAAWLHDVVEDTNVVASTIEREFGFLVRSYVMEVTEVSTLCDGNRAARKKIDREHYGRASASGKAIKLADMISNTRSIIAHDVSFAKVYLAEKRALLPLLQGSAAPMLYSAAWHSLENAEYQLRLVKEAA